MNKQLELLINTNRAKLTKMIEKEEPYEKIVEQSQLLDKYRLCQVKCVIFLKFL